MVKMRDELSIEDLISLTKAVRILRPALNEYVCVGVQAPRLGDRNVIFHMRGPENSDCTRDETVVMISADLILEMFGGTGNVAERYV
jgi:hypothetical protein